MVADRHLGQQPGAGDIDRRLGPESLLEASPGCEDLDAGTVRWQGDGESTAELASGHEDRTGEQGESVRRVCHGANHVKHRRVLSRGSVTRHISQPASAGGDPKRTGCDPGRSDGRYRAAVFDVYAGAESVEGAGVRLRVADHGPVDGPPVLLVHGFPDTAYLWRHQVPALVDAGHRVIVPDLRGFGGSDKPLDVADYSLRRHAGDIAAILKSKGISRARIVGHDWGAALSWYLTIVSPALVERLVVLSVGHPSSFASVGVEQRARSWYMLLFQFEGIGEQWLRRDAWKGLAEWSRGHQERSRWIETLSEPGALEAALNIYRANMPPETWVAPAPALPAAPCDVMGVWSTGDFALLESQMIGSSDYVAGEWRYERIEGASHWIPLDAPDRLNELLIDFLA